jgi:hypothetical protein
MSSLWNRIRPGLPLILIAGLTSGLLLGCTSEKPEECPAAEQPVSADEQGVYIAIEMHLDWVCDAPPRSIVDIDKDTPKNRTAEERKQLEKEIKEIMRNSYKESYEFKYTGSATLKEVSVTITCHDAEGKAAQKQAAWKLWEPGKCHYVALRFEEIDKHVQIDIDGKATMNGNQVEIHSKFVKVARKDWAQK